MIVKKERFNDWAALVRGGKPEAVRTKQQRATVARPSGDGILYAYAQ
jgi:hypothetical protein